MKRSFFLLTLSKIGFRTLLPDDLAGIVDSGGWIKDNRLGDIAVDNVNPQ